MSPARRRTLGCLPGLVAGAFIFSTSLFAQPEKPAPPPPPGDSEAVLRQLLSEVRQLRLALQRSTLLTTRFQVAIERMRIQQAHVDGLNHELSGLRETMAAKETELSSLVERRKGFEEQLDQVAGPDRTEMENNIRLLKAAAASREKENQENRAREADLAGQVQNAQARLDDLDRELDALTKELQEP